MVMNRSMDALNEDIVSFDVREYQNSAKSVMLGGVRVKSKLDKSRNRYENPKSSEALSGALQKSDNRMRNPWDVLKPEPTYRVSLPSLTKNLKTEQSDTILEEKARLPRQYSKQELILLERKKNRDLYFNHKPTVAGSPGSKMPLDYSRLSLSINSRPYPRSNNKFEIASKSNVALEEREVQKVRRRVLDEYFRSAKLSSSE